MDVITLLREQIRGAHEYLDDTMSDVTPEQAQWIPPGKATPIGANYIHLVQTEDALIQTLRGREMLGTSEWAGRIGASEPQPAMPWEEQVYFDWSRRVQVDLPALRQYAKAVYAATDEYLAGVAAEDLDKSPDLSSQGMSPVTLGWILTRYIAGHADNICGEVSCMKGMQGARGYAE